MRKSRTLSVLCLSVLSTQMWGQTAPPANTGAASTQSSGTDDLKDLRERIAKQEEELKKMQESLAAQQVLLEKAMQKAEQSAAPVVQNAAAAPVETAADPAKLVPVVNVAARANNRQQNQHYTEPSSPISLSIGNAKFTPFGFVDATFFLRSTAVGSGIGTNFAGIPFNNAAAGHLSETNFSAQNSRIGLRVDSDFMGWNILGYLETDFLFNNNANSFQIGSNSAGLRLRNYFVDANDGKFEVLAGQDWSMLTPNRKGISPVPSDIFYTQNMDTNYQVGLVWTRAPQFRFIAHPNDHIAYGVALENPQQYLGGGNGSGAATLPAGLSSIQGQFQYSPGLNVANSITNVPNLMPDIQAKVAFDGSRAHLEVAGFVSGFKDYILPSVGNGTIPGSHSAFGGGLEVNSNIALTKNLHFVENVFWSDGGGRYLFGEVPDTIVKANGDLSLIHSGSTLDGFEWQVRPKSQLALYYGGIYAGRNTAFDPKAVKSGGTATATPEFVGYGYAGHSGFAGPSATQNRAIQELTADWTETFFKNKNYGALSLINQYSYIVREPWATTATSPRQAHENLIYINLRYTLP